MRKFFVMTLVLFFGILPAVGENEIILGRWKQFEALNGQRLVDWLRKETELFLEGKKGGGDFALKTPPWYGKLGFFITLVRAGRVRGCYGSFNHTSSDFSVTMREYLKGALRRDPRYTPLGVEEVEETAIIVTVASQPRGVTSIENIDLSHNGIYYMFQDGSSAVVVPAEMKTVDYLKRNIEVRGVMSRSVFRAITIKSKKHE